MQEEKKRIVILGCTGSIGTQTLDVVRQHPEKLQVVGLSAHTRAQELEKYAREFGVEHTVLGNAFAKESGECGVNAGFAANSNAENAHAEKEASIANAIKNLIEQENVDIVVNALVGAAGVRASYDTLKAGKVLALANKESLVVAGDIIMPLARKLDACKSDANDLGEHVYVAQETGERNFSEKKQDAKKLDARNQSNQKYTESSPLTQYLMPIDSEHGAIYQCLMGENAKNVSKLWITASGGPFRGRTREDLKNITPAQALAHPTWNMGAKISIDSSTLMNKGLEVIEAHHLFNMSYEKIEVVVQPQSAIHSMVEYCDGSVLAHLGTTDMRIPIQFALSAPNRWSAPTRPLDFRTLGSLDFEAPDTKTFRCLELAKHAGRTGGTLPCVMNAANEVAVNAFLQEKCAYLDIPEIIERVMSKHERAGVEIAQSINQLLEWDAWARNCARTFVK